MCWFTYLCIKTIILNNMHFRVTVVKLQRGNTAIFFLTLGITPECLWVHRILYYVLNVYIVFWTDDNGIWNNYMASYLQKSMEELSGQMMQRVCNIMEQSSKLNTCSWYFTKTKYKWYAHLVVMSNRTKNI